MVENIEQTDKQDVKKDNQQKETLDQILESKISDKDTLNKVKPVLNEIQNSFSQPINNYIKTLDELEFSNIADANEDDKKALLIAVDTFLNKNWTPEIVNVIPREKKVYEENKEENKENKKEKKEEKDTVTEKDTLLETRKATQESYNKLDAKYKAKDTEKDKIETIKNNISSIKKKALEDAKVDVNTYANFIFTKEVHGEELKKAWNTEFLDNLEKLEKILPGERTSLANTKNPEHTDALVATNSSLNNFANNSDKFDKITTPPLPESKDFDKEFDLYVKFISDKNVRNSIQANKDLIKTFRTNTDKKNIENPAGKKANEEYATAIAEVKENLPSRSQTIIKQRVMGSCISGLAKYFDSSTINKDNFSKDFDISAQDGFSINKWTDQNEKSDDVLYINGNIKGNSVGFYYNLTNPDAQLKSDDFLHFDGVSEAFALGIHWWWKNSLWVKLPTLGLLTAQAQKVSENKFTTLLENSSSNEDFEASFKEEISKELLKNYWQEALVKTRVERDVEKNITAQTLNTTFIPEAVLGEMNRDKSINKTTENKARKLLNIRDKSTENMRSDELRKFRSLIERSDKLISREDHGNLEPKRQKALKGIDEERWAENYSDQRWSKTLKFFKKFSKNDQVNLQDLDTFVTTLEKKENLAGNMHKFSPDFQTAEEHENAEGLLQQIV